MSTLSIKDIKPLLERLTQQKALPRAQWQFKPINHGLSSQVWLLSSAGNESLICRVTNSNKEQTFNSQKGLSLQQQLSETGISAKIYHQSQIKGFDITLMEYIQGSQQLASTWSEQQRKRFAEQLVKLHKSQITHQLKKLDICAHLNSYIQQLKPRLKPQQLSNYQLAVDKICKQLNTYDATNKAIGQQGICHNDLNRLNIVYSANKHQFVLLDWDEAHIGDCFFDLAGFTIEHQLTQEQSRQWLEYYFIALNQTRNLPANIEQITQKLAIYQQAYRLVCELWHRLFKDGR